MSWLLFLDESGHDHKSMPYEVRGGFAIHTGKLWPFVQAMQDLELRAFGSRLHLYQKELKGSTLLDRKRYKFAKQSDLIEDDSRRKLSRSFLQKGLEKKSPSRDEFTAYGQACLEMARGIFELLRSHGAQVFAAAIPRSVQKPVDARAEEYLRKDQIYLLERFFYMLESERQHGLLVMDQCDVSEDRRFVRRLEAYFSKTQRGRYRTAWIVPSPFFVSSEMAYGVQAADLCIYCINLGFRLPRVGMNADTRPEIEEEFGPWLHALQFRGEGHWDGKTFPTWGICYVPEPYTGSSTGA